MFRVVCATLGKGNPGHEHVEVREAHRRMWIVERAVSPVTGTVTPLVVDGKTYEPHPHAKDFAQYLRGAGRSPETSRAYLPRVARFLNWCSTHARDPLRVTVIDMSRYRCDLEGMTRRDGSRVGPGTVAAHLTAVLEFLRFCGAYGYADADVIGRLSKPRFLHHTPAGFDAGEDNQRRFVESPVVRVRVPTVPPDPLTEEQVSSVLVSPLSPRDRFLINCLLDTGARIGEVLGLRRQDLHLLPDSSALGCRVRGAHLHIRPRQDNVNHARVKAGIERVVPVSAGLVATYREYQVSRERCGPAGVASDHVFVTLRGSTIGQAMTYSNTVQLVKRLGVRVGIPGLHPHQFRHTAATAWLRAGVKRDVVQELLGHAAPSSTAVYLHFSDEEKRAAVERVAAIRRGGKSQ